MVKYKCCPGVIPDLLPAHFIKGIHGLQIQVVDLSKINLCSDDFPGLYMGTAAVLCKNLFNCMHFFSSFTPPISYIVYDIQSTR